MELKPTLKTDVNILLTMETDVANRAFISPYSLDRHRQVITDKDEEHLSIFDKDYRLIGFVILAGLTNKNRSIEFRRIVVSEKGKGYGSAAIELIKKRCFGKYSCNRLWLDVFEFNKRAIRIYERLGFRKEGILRECIKADQGYKSLLIMSILRREYLTENF